MRAFNAVKITVLLGTVSLTVLPAHTALAQASLIESLERMKAGCIIMRDLLGKHEQELNQESARLRRISNSDHAALCTYNRTRGLPLVEAQLAALRREERSNVCFDNSAREQLRHAVQLVDLVKTNMARDCKKAGR